MKLILNLIIYLNYLFLINLSNLVLLYPIIFLVLVFKDFYINNKFINKQSENTSKIEDKNNKNKIN